MSDDLNLNKTHVLRLNRRTIATLAVIVVFFAAGFAAGRSNTPAAAKNVPGQVVNVNASLPEFLTKDVNFDLFWRVWSTVKANYVEQPVPDTKLFYGALSGIVSSLNDPYSVFFTPKEAADFQNDLSGEFEGIGAEIGIKNSQLLVVAPLDDTPATRAGLRAGDFIIAIDKKDTAGMPVEQAVSLIRGKKGTEVNLTIYREGFEKPEDFKIRRDKIYVKSVKWEMKNDVAYIKVSHFNDDTSVLFNQAIKELVAQKHATKLIVDLRNDPGGFLDTAVDLAGRWIDNGVVVREKFFDGQEKIYTSKGKAPLKGLKTVVLINKGSASASEILSGALQDAKLATIVGEQSFGKGSVQTLDNLPDGSSIKITVAKWLTPSGRTIDKQGITPDVKVEFTKKDFDSGKDPQLDKALELVNK